LRVESNAREALSEIALGDRALAEVNAAAKNASLEKEAERRVESRVRAAETRVVHETQQKEELFLSKSRLRDQEWQAKLDGV